VVEKSKNPREFKRINIKHKVGLAYHLLQSLAYFTGWLFLFCACSLETPRGIKNCY